MVAEILLAAELAGRAGPLGEAALEAAAVSGVLGPAAQLGDELLLARRQRELGEAAPAAAHVALRHAVRLVAVAADLAAMLLLLLVVVVVVVWNEKKKRVG